MCYLLDFFNDLHFEFRYELFYLLSLFCNELMVLLQKRQLAAQSNAFNLKDKIFCELFPEDADVSNFITVFILNIFFSLGFLRHTNCQGHLRTFPVLMLQESPRCKPGQNL